MSSVSIPLCAVHVPPLLHLVTFPFLHNRSHSFPSHFYTVKDVSIVTMEHDESVALQEEAAEMQRILSFMVDQENGLKFSTIDHDGEALPYCFKGPSLRPLRDSSLC